MDTVHDHIWDAVNAHLGTSAHSFPELVEQLGIMRFGHRPELADTFCGSGQIPFEAARLGCDVYASDLNPVACMLTWGAFNIVGGSAGEPRRAGDRISRRTASTRCRQRSTAWRRDRRPRLASQGISLLCRSPLPADGLDGAAACRSRDYQQAASASSPNLMPDPANKTLRHRDPHWGQRRQKLRAAETRHRSAATAKYSDAYLDHIVDGVSYKTKISTLRGDYRNPTGRRQSAAAVGEARLQAATRRHLPGASLLHPMDAAKEEGQEVTNTSSAP